VYALDTGCGTDGRRVVTREARTHPTGRSRRSTRGPTASSLTRPVGLGGSEMVVGGGSVGVLNYADATLTRIAIGR